MNHFLSQTTDPSFVEISPPVMGREISPNIDALSRNSEFMTHENDANPDFPWWFSDSKLSNYQRVEIIYIYTYINII